MAFFVTTILLVDLAPTALLAHPPTSALLRSTMPMQNLLPLCPMCTWIKDLWLLHPMAAHPLAAHLPPSKVPCPAVGPLLLFPQSPSEFHSPTQMAGVGQMATLPIQFPLPTNKSTSLTLATLFTSSTEALSQVGSRFGESTALEFINAWSMVAPLLSVQGSQSPEHLESRLSPPSQIAQCTSKG